MVDATWEKYIWIINYPITLLFIYRKLTGYHKILLTFQAYILDMINENPKTWKKTGLNNKFV